ncbi:translation initiation factor IF-2-like protein [Labeo rohita]|uniref:Translation initiation factor IF-2-like protein n=1 Tax=Labeo rohita TaxID=84645 RepID=A0A498LK54_LABRO|nr:translation initiation factor IF-2-like protein [Labeo rohita]
MKAKGAPGAYHAAGQAATALHAMASLQVYQAQALKHVHEGGPDQGDMQDLRAATTDKGDGTFPWPGDVHSCGPGATPMADPGSDGRRRQSSLSPISPPSPRAAYSATPSRTLPSNSRRSRSRRRR